ncbi:MAG: hypothetical protein HKN14_00085 [Marinicaulis sp.]|nr:hypothetical protein [Marinicaulis sp.]
MRSRPLVGVVSIAVLMFVPFVQAQVPEGPTSVPVAIENERAPDDYAALQTKDLSDLQFNPVAEFEVYRAMAARHGFNATEEKLLAEATNTPNNDAGEAGLRVVYFYLAHGFYAEALAIPAKGADAAIETTRALLDAISLYKLGRWGQARAKLDQDQLNGLEAAVAWRAVTNAKLGAFEKAAEDFFNRAPRQIPHEENAIDYFLARAETALETGRLNEIRPSLDHLRVRTLNGKQRAHRRLIEGKAMLRADRGGAARSMFVQLAKENTQPYSARAEIEILHIDFARNEISSEAAESELQSLALSWRGGDFERELLNARALFADQRDDIETAMQARRKLVDLFSAADAAAPALQKMKTDLAGLFARRELSPVTAARVFYENIDLAPPGRDGDRLIRNVVDQLVSLELLEEASELLAHQTFNRLRGDARSIAAADLAAIHLAKGAPGAAISTLERSARTRLDPHVQNRRSTLLARAHLALSDDRAAHEAINGVLTKQASIIRGDIAWNAEEFANAGAAYWAAINHSGDDAPLTGVDIDLAMRSAAAYSLAEDFAALREVANSLQGRVTDDNVMQIIDTFSAPGFENAEQFLSAYSKRFADVSGDV